MSKMNLLMLVDRLQEMGSSNFQFAGKVLLDREELEELINKMQTAFPEELKQAEFVSREKERYLRQAHEEAEKIIREAEGYANELVRQDRIMTQAETEARRIIDEAKFNANQIETQAREYADQVMSRLEDSLDRTLRVVRQSREGLLDEEEE